MKIKWHVKGGKTRGEMLIAEYYEFIKFFDDTLTLTT